MELKSTSASEPASYLKTAMKRRELQM
jgi:hypothetical protein